MEYDSTRKSHCVGCGTRLSEKSDDGAILWQPGQVDDTGLYCQACFAAKKKARGNKGKPTEEEEDIVLE